MEEGEHGNTKTNTFLEETIKKKKNQQPAETWLKVPACNIYRGLT